MADFGIGEALMAASLAMTAASATYTGVEQHKAEKEQKAAIEEADKKQAEADREAEKQRLEALAKNQQDQSGFDFGIDSVLAKRYADAAQKWEAGTGSKSSDDEENPFYTKGLI